MTSVIENEVKHLLTEGHSLSELFEKISGVFWYIWNYTVFVTDDKHQILFSNIVISLILFLLGLKLATKLSLALKRKMLSKLDINTASFLERISYYFFIIIITIFVLDISNVPLTVFAVIGTTFALGIGLGSQNIANNFISGLIIMIERPIKFGDIIEIKGMTGKVREIGARCVSIQTDDNVTILVPNSNILQDVIVNWTHDGTVLRTIMNFRIENQLSIDDLDKVITSELQKHSQILQDPPMQIFYKLVCKNYYEIDVEFWINIGLGAKAKEIKSNINRGLAETLKNYNIAELEILKKQIVSA